MRSKIRIPKPETRRRTEVRNPKVEAPVTCGVEALRALDGRDTLWPAGCRRSRLTVSALGFRISGFLRASAFGLRILSPGLWFFAGQPIFAAVTNTSAGDELPALRPPHGELPPGYWEQHGVWTILAGTLVLVLAGVAIWALTRPKPAIVVPPELEARRALGPLRQRPEDGLLLSQISQILRRYVAAAFGLPPGELTTAEFCRAVAGHQRVGSELASALSDFLRQCDERKFSPPPPAPPLSAAAHALKLIDQAEARLAALARPPAQPSGSPEAARSNPGNEK
jgi:hypothetical protein